MNLADILVLAKQGYKPADVKELIALADQVEPQEEPKEVSKEVSKEMPKEEPEKDLSIYEKRIADLEAKLAAAQKANVTQNIQTDDVANIEKTATSAIIGLM